MKKGISTGIDIISIERIRRAGQSRGFLNRVFTKAEFGLWQNEKALFRRLAGCFAAKEAFAKALGTGMANGLKWKDIETAAGKEGVNPRLSLHNNATRLLGSRKAHLSIAYSKDHAFAFVVIE
ncbi:MAG: holo-ACP synthase [Deltaproteobacteria bacterium]|nr:holo-ACP synthase [Deltaproteobacteria bacterium]